MKGLPRYPAPNLRCIDCGQSWRSVMSADGIVGGATVTSKDMRRRIWRCYPCFQADAKLGGDSWHAKVNAAIEALR